MKRMIESLNPMTHRWPFVEPITREEVMAAVKAGHLEGKPSNTHEQELISAGREDGITLADRVYHIRRVAFFVKHGIPEQDSIPIELETNGIALKIIDGRHRFAAAFIRGDKTINVMATSDILRLIPNAEPLPSSGGAVAKPRAPEA
jgi:hypothetical protein